MLCTIVHGSNEVLNDWPRLRAKGKTLRNDFILAAISIAVIHSIMLGIGYDALSACEGQCVMPGTLCTSYL